MYATLRSPLRERRALRRLVLHAGLHKTGSTALQMFLSDASEKLRQHHILYPRAGVPTEYPYGHHNIAWQLAADRRFRAAFGTVDDLAQEIAQFAGDVIISSEDFESILDRPERFAPLRKHPALRQHKFVLVFYVRNQASYLESLFLQMIHLGFGEELTVFAQPLFRQGQLQMHDWVFQFDYARPYRACKAWHEMQVVIGNYHRLRGDSVITDFFDVASLDPMLEVANVSMRANARAPLTYTLQRFYQNRVQRPLDPRETEMVQRLCERIGDRPVMLSAELKATLAAVFRKSNHAFCAASGLPPECLKVGDRDVAEAIPLEHLFSIGLQRFIAEGGIDKRDSSEFCRKLGLPPQLA